MDSMIDSTNSEWADPSTTARIRSALLQDRLVEETNVLFFKMDVTRLMNYFPCLVIRGICDCSDTYKNKTWQVNTAIAAAAYAEAVLL